MSQTKDWIYFENSKEIFRKTEFYELKWSLENTFLAVSDFAGPMEDKSTIIGMGWTSFEDLVIVKETGEVQIRSMFGEIKPMLNVVKDSRAVSFRIFHTINSYTGAYTTGIVVLTAKNKFMLVKDLYDPKLQQFPEIPGLGDPDSWCVISNEKRCFILVAKGTDIYQLVFGGSPQILKVNLNVPFNSIQKMQPSFANDCIALSTDTGYLVMANNDLTRILSRYQSESKEATKQIAWITNRAVVAFWDSLFLIPLEGDDLKIDFEIFYTEPIHLVQEIDGVRIITSEKNEFLQIVPRHLRDVFEIGAVEVSSTLYESSIAFYDSKSQKAEEYIRSIKEKGKLEEAISNCINAASNEFDPRYQIELLRAALFGRYFDDYANAAPYVKMCQIIRVLNAVRHAQIGLPLTYIQFEALSPSVIISRLITRRHFALAIEICKYLNMADQDGIIKILSNWALYKVSQTDVEDERIAIMIKTKLGDTPGISYAEIARCAIKAGRSSLAIKLLEYETKASEQVPLYIEINNPELALRKAMESGDSDLIYMVLFWYKTKFNNLSDFMKDISKRYPPAFNLMLQKNLEERDSSELGDILNQENLIMEQVCLILKVLQRQERIEQKIQMLDEARRLFGNDDKFNSSIINDDIKLAKIQLQLEKTYRIQLCGKTLYETLAELFRCNWLEDAEKIRKEFKLSDSTESWWHLKAKNLSQGNLWEELEKFAKSKKSLIGYEPFVYYCMEMNNVQEAKKYFPKVMPENRFRCLIKMKCLADALDVASQNKDTIGINLVIRKCDPNTQKALIDKAKALKASLNFRVS